MKSTVYVIDTNVILRYLLADHEEFYDRVRAFMEEVRHGNKKVLILDSVIAECVYVLLKAYNVPREEIAEKLAGILEYKGVVNSDRENLLEALAIFAVENIDIVDALVFAFGSLEENREVFSFDKDLKKLARTRKEKTFGQGHTGKGTKGNKNKKARETCSW